MTTATTAYLAQVGLACALALIAVSYWPAQIPTGVEGGITVSQYCAPPEESTDTHRFYCRHGSG
jgi:hypothetical protein